MIIQLSLALQLLVYKVICVICVPKIVRIVSRFDVAANKFPTNVVKESEDK